MMRVLQPHLQAYCRSSCSVLHKRLIHVTQCTCKIVTSPVEDIQISRGNYYQNIIKNVHKWKHSPALICSLTNRSVTYGQLADYSARWNGFLRSRGISKGERISVIHQNSIPCIAAFLGSVAAGVTVAPINEAYTTREMAGQLQEILPSLVLTSPGLEPAVQQALDAAKLKPQIVTTGNSTLGTAINIEEILDNKDIPFGDPVELTGQEPLAILYSSGTAGKPKGTVLSHNALNSNNSLMYHEYFTTCSDTTDDNQDVFMLILPMFHIFGMVVLGLSVEKGIKNIVVPQFDPSSYVKTIAEHKVNHLHIVPPILNFLAAHPSCTKESMAHLTSVLCGASVVHPSSTKKFLEKVDKKICFQEAYGLTELCALCIGPVNSDRIGTCGQLLPNIEAKVISTSTGEGLPAGESGEICIRSPSRMSYYLNNQEATFETIDQLGFLHTGDIGYFDEEGFFYIVDRTKDLIKVQSFQVSPSEIEDIIKQHPDVSDAAVIGIPHERLGEAPKAFIISKKPLGEEDIHRFLEPLLAKHKRLAGGITFVDKIPTSPTGKVLRRILREV